MAKNFMTSDITIPGTGVKFPAWAIVAAVGGILAVLILAPKRADQGDFNEEGMYADDSAGGAWLLIEELMDLMQGSGVSEILDPIVDNPRPTLYESGDEPAITFADPFNDVSPWSGGGGFAGDFDVSVFDMIKVEGGRPVVYEPTAEIESRQTWQNYFTSWALPGKAAVEAQKSYDPRAIQPMSESPVPFVSSLGNWFEANPISPIYTPPAPVPTQTPYQDERQYTLPQYLAPVAPAAASVDYSPVQTGATSGGLIA